MANKTVAQLKTELNEKGVKFSSKDKKADLEKKLEVANQSAKTAKKAAPAKKYPGEY